jgi:hypothetical protein
MSIERDIIKAVTIWVIGRLDRCRAFGMVEASGPRLTDKSRQLYEHLNEVLQPSLTQVTGVLEVIGTPPEHLDDLTRLVMASDLEINKFMARFN